LSPEEKKAANRERCRRWRERHPGAQTAKAAKWRAEHPEYAKAHYLKNREKIIARAAAWHKQNRERYSRYVAEYRKRHVEKNRLYFRDNYLLKKYGLTFAEMQQMLATQGFKCALCGDPIDEVTRNVDHDHATGVNRALLCDKCNWALGLLKDSPELLEKAAAYVRGFRAAVQPEASVPQ
jgi:hypothetical protein